MRMRRTAIRVLIRRMRLAPGKDVTRIDAHDRRSQPPATAGTMVTSAFSGTVVSNPFKKRMSSPSM